MAGTVFIVSAPSGAGKTTLCRKAVDFFPDLRHSVSYTTRAPRHGEVNGVDYWFVDAAAFDRMEQAGEFLEHAVVHGRRYGTSRKDLEGLLRKGLDVILDIDVQGAGTVKASIPGGVYVFILPPSLEACEARLHGRGKDSPEEIRRRLDIARGEIRKAPLYDYIIINDELDHAFDALKSIITAEGARKERMMPRVREVFGKALGPGV
jgi:guanylate kinase